jgi:DNA topoisomerase IB
LTGPDIRQALAGWDRLSGQDAGRDNQLDRIVVYATAGGDGFRPAELQQRLHTLALPYTAEEVNRALQRLELAYIVGRDADGVHRYRVPLFIDMIREWNLDLALAEECEAARSAWNK